MTIIDQQVQTKPNRLPFFQADHSWAKSWIFKFGNTLPKTDSGSIGNLYIDKAACDKGNFSSSKAALWSLVNSTESSF